MRVVAPSELLGPDGRPRALTASPEYVSEIAIRHRLDRRGQDLAVSFYLPLSALSRRGSAPALTYLSAARFQGALVGSSGLAVVTREELADLVPEGNAVLLAEGATPRDVFYSLLAEAVGARRFEALPSFVSPSARVSPAAHVGEGVYVDDEATIGPGAVVLSGTYVGRGVVIKSNATVGGDGFECAEVDGRRTVVPHAGGVWLAEGVHVGSATCVDRGLFGEFSFAGPFTTMDNLIHFAHAVTTGAGCSLIACCEISGSVALGDGVWVGPNAAINQGLKIGDHCYIGTSAVVTRDLPAHSLAYGSPAKVAAQVCACRTKLTFVDGKATCDDCGTSYRVAADGGVRRA